MKRACGWAVCGVVAGIMFGLVGGYLLLMFGGDNLDRLVSV